MGLRVSLAIELQLEDGQTGQGVTKSLEFKIDGLQLSASGGVFRAGETEFDITLESGARRIYQFNAANSGVFDILCDGTRIGAFIVNLN